MSEKKYGHTLEYDGPFMCDYVKHELTGMCKKVTGGVGSSGKPVHYYQAATTVWYPFVEILDRGK